VPLIIESSLPEQPPPPPFYGHFSETTQVSRCQKKIFFWTFMVQGRITEADTPTIRLGATPSGQISNQSPTSPIFMLDAFLPQPSLYPGFGQATNICWTAYTVVWFSRTSGQKNEGERTTKGSWKMAVKNKGRKADCYTCVC